MSKPSRRSTREARKAQPARNPWTRDTGVNGDDPHAVRAACADRLVKLRQMAQDIRRDDDKIRRRAATQHDHHVAEASRLAEEIHHVGVGNDPLLEDAHAHHLSQARHAEETLARLRDRIGSY